MKISPKNIKDYTEPVWFLGTDILTDRDRELMNEGVLTSFLREYGAIYHVEYLDDGCHKIYLDKGYSKYFVSLLEEAKQRTYMWLFFDRDIETEGKTSGVNEG